MEVWSFLIPILLTDVLNPVLFAFMVYAAGTRRPVLTPATMLFGHTIAYFSAGFVLLLFRDAIQEYLANPGTIEFVIQIALALLLLWLAFGSRKDQGKRPEEDTAEFSLLSAFGFGAVINFIGIPFAVPYFAALDHISRSGMDDSAILLALVTYNLLYALPFVLVPALTLFMGKSAQPVLSRINIFLDRVSGFLMPLLLGLVGLGFLVDAAVYFWRGTPLF